MTHRLASVIIVGLAAIALFIAPTMVLYFDHRANVEACHDRQRGYDGQVFIVRFIGHELHASEPRINQALDHLRAERGERPKC